MLGYEPLVGPTDFSFMLPVLERLVDAAADRRPGREIEPILAEKVDEDPGALKITWHIRKGVIFHDGSPLDAETVRWNFQQMIDAKALPYVKFLKRMRVVDDHTLVMELTEYSNQLVPSWGSRPPIHSKAAWDKASGGDLQKGIDWARANVVGTGPFVLESYKRDNLLTYRRNPNYWRKGKPYLDRIEYRLIPESMVAWAMMQVGEADVWEGPLPGYQSDLVKRGLQRQVWWPAIAVAIWVNTANPKSKWQDKRLREALEYALDRDAIARAMGFGLCKALKSLPPPGEWGYDPTYDPRPYDPARARKLLADAGYASGLDARMMVYYSPETVAFATAIKQYLDAAGFRIDLDPADPGRYYAAVYGDRIPGPDEDLAIFIIGSDPNYLMTYLRWLSTEPFTNIAYLGHTREQAELDRQAVKVTGVKEQRAMTRRLVRYLTDNALVVPIMNMPVAVMRQPWVHSTHPEPPGVLWRTEETWMEKR
jgi:ABC-type transport system substrate-binding protein